MRGMRNINQKEHYITLHYNQSRMQKSEGDKLYVGNNDDNIDHNSLLTSIFIHAVAIIRRGAVSIIVTSLSITRPAALCSMCGTFIRIELV